MNVIKILYSGVWKLLHHAGPGSETILNHKACAGAVIRRFHQTINTGKDGSRTNGIAVLNAMSNHPDINSISGGLAESGVVVTSVGKSRYVTGPAWRPLFTFQSKKSNKFKDVDLIPVYPASGNCVVKPALR